MTLPYATQSPRIVRNKHLLLQAIAHFRTESHILVQNHTCLRSVVISCDVGRSPVYFWRCCFALRLCLLCVIASLLKQLVFAAFGVVCVCVYVFDVFGFVLLRLYPKRTNDSVYLKQRISAGPIILSTRTFRGLNI